MNAQSVMAKKNRMNMTLINRLQRHSKQASVTHGMLMREAADEIESLQDKLRLCCEENKSLTKDAKRWREG